MRVHVQAGRQVSLGLPMARGSASDPIEAFMRVNVRLVGAFDLSILVCEERCHEEHWVFGAGPDEPPADRCRVHCCRAVQIMTSDATDVQVWGLTLGSD